MKLYKNLSDKVNTTTQAVIDDHIWQLCFDWVSQSGPNRGIIAGVGIVLISHQKHVIPRAFTLTEPCSNNVAEYNALLIGMEIARELGAKNLEAYGNFQLIINQIYRQYEVRHEDLVPYHEAVIKTAREFANFYVEHRPF